MNIPSDKREPFDNKYPDTTPADLSNLKEIKRLPRMRKVAPKIKWGDTYKGLVKDKAKGRCWTDKDRLDYAERLASSMNHAADILQQERDKLLATVAHLEEQLKANAKAYKDQGNLMHSEIGAAGAEKQELYELIVTLRKHVKAQAIKVRTLTKQIKEMEGE
jgi:hypothetical protein